MRNFRITLRGALLTISAIAVWMAVFQKSQAIAKLDAKIQFAEANQRDVWQNRSWSPWDDQIAIIGPRYGNSRTSPHGDEAWYGREFWIYVPGDRPYGINLQVYDPQVDPPYVRKADATAPLSPGVHIMRWDMPDWWAGQTTFAIWIDDKQVISKKIPLSAPSNGLSGLIYSVQDRASIRVKASFSFVPNGEPQFSKVSEFMEFWLAPMEE